MTDGAPDWPPTPRPLYCPPYISHRKNRPPSAPHKPHNREIHYEATPRKGRGRPGNYLGVRALLASRPPSRPVSDPSLDDVPSSPAPQPTAFHLNFSLSSPSTPPTPPLVPPPGFRSGSWLFSSSSGCLLPHPLPLPMSLHPPSSLPIPYPRLLLPPPSLKTYIRSAPYIQKQKQNKRKQKKIQNKHNLRHQNTK